MWSGDGTEHYVYGTGGDSLSHFCCPTAAATDFVCNTATAAATTAAAKSARPAAAGHHSSATSSATADPAPTTAPTGNAAFSINFSVLTLSALLAFLRGTYQSS